MRLSFAIAAILLLALGAAHTWLGEKYILIPLFRRENLPSLFGSDEFTKRTLRFAWHLTTVVWWGIAALLLMLSSTQFEGSTRTLSGILVVTFLVSALVSLVGSRGRHPSWLVFLVVALLTWVGSR